MMFKYVLFDDFESMLLQKLKLTIATVSKTYKKDAMTCLCKYDDTRAPIGDTEITIGTTTEA